MLDFSVATAYLRHPFENPTGFPHGPGTGMAVRVSFLTVALLRNNNNKNNE
jgi:hypothetical protein